MKKHRSTADGTGDSHLRMDLVEKYRREIAQSTYKVKSREIAEKIGQKLREEEGAKLRNSR